MRGAAKRIADITVEMEPDDDEPQEGAECDKPVKADIVLRMPEIALQWVSVKAGADEWTLDVLGVPFGGPFDGKDHDKQYFDGSTKIYNDFYQTIPAVYGHGADPTGKRAAKPAIVGKATYSHKDERGHWYKVILDRASEYARRLWDAAKAGAARASSGSMAHMVRFGAGGHIDEWPVTEMTLVDVGTSKLIPANPYAVALPAMKAAYDAAGLELREKQPEAAAGVKATGAADITNQSTKGFLAMTPEEQEALNKLLDERDARKAAATAEAQKAAEVETLRKENEAMKAQIAAANRLPGGAPHVREYADTDKYDGLSAADTALVADVLRSSGRPIPVGMVKAIALKTARENDGYAKSSLKAAGFGDLSDAAIKAVTDPMYSTLSNAGAEWVGTAYSNQLWEALRANLQVVGRIPSVVIPDGYSSEYFPVESTDPTWYKVAQTTANDSTMGVPAATVTHSQMTTAQKQITVAKMGARVSYTGEMVEDSLIPFAAQLRLQIAKSGAEMMEYVVIDGDTATSSNINDIGGTTYSGAATSLFLLTNGFRKSPLVTTTTQSRSAAGGFNVEDFLATMKLLGSNGLGASDPRQAVFIVDTNTWFAAAQLPEAKDANQTVLRVTDGFVNRAYGFEVIPSWFMHKNSATRKANTAGKVDQDTVGNNAYGAILAVRLDQWKLAYKRRMTMEVTRRPESDTWEIVALTRWGLGQRDTLAAAETYYVGV
jgi:hypothetical protein